ncbi:hypothetical protein [Nocardia macrotermitis]|uniref:Uncharacterized protein n=1 Tax=Nocardia macrotermitis TaxID=2585198 RepID=A0A7K0D4L8_9NOCA|nr:hypothetical protein [Nocardia macrotermitis]MQY20695.1 hypothetical protein [Nocardia macrotermitis]
MAAEHDGQVSSSGEGRAVSRGEVVRRVGWGALALSEAILRTRLLQGVALFSLIVMVFGAMAGNLVMTVVCVGVGLVGLVLFGVALKRRWPAGRQWVFIAVVFAVDISLIVVAADLGR